MKHLAQPGGDGPQLRLGNSGGHFHRRQSLRNQLPDEINIGVVLKRHGDLRQPELRDRADLDQPRQSAHQQLDRKGDEPLDLGRDQAGHVGVDLHLHGRGIGKGVDI